MEKKSYQPYALTILLIAAASAVIAATVRPMPLGNSGIILDQEDNPVLPERVGIWVGEDQEVSQMEIDFLPKDTRFARKMYQDPGGNVIFCSIVLSGADRGSIHRPEVCLPGQGWTIQNSDVVGIPLNTSEGAVLRARRLQISKPMKVAENQTMELMRYSYYWFVGSDLTTHDHGDRIMHTMSDRVLKNVSHRWAYVTVAPFMVPQGKEEQVEQIVFEFIKDLFPQFHQPEVFPSPPKT